MKNVSFEYYEDIAKLNSGPRYVVGAKPKLDREKLVVGTRIALD